MQHVLSVFIAVFLMASVISPAEARMWNSEADQIDPEFRQNDETYNDILSYQMPPYWRDWLNEHENQFYASAGSLNVRIFDYYEHVRLHTDWQKTVSFGFLHHRHEDYVHAHLEREVRLNYRHSGTGLFVSMLADSDSLKEYADVGLALGIRRSKQAHVEIRAWSNDHYFNSKRGDDRDELLSGGLTYGLIGRWPLPFGLNWSGRFIYDPEIRYQWVSRGFAYRYKRVFNRQALNWQDGHHTVEIKGFYEKKSERKDWYDGLGALELDRRVERYDLSYRRQLGGKRSWGAQLMSVSRAADYPVELPASGNIDDLPEKNELDRGRRLEQGAFVDLVTGCSPTCSIYGLILNYGQIERPAVRGIFEAKLLTGWDWRIDENAGFYLNITWDLDQLGRDYPYHKAPFKPWGGGNGQFIYVF